MILEGSKTRSLALRALPIEKLRHLYVRYCQGTWLDANFMSASALRSEISRQVSTNLDLAKELGSITVRPSFYLMRASLKSADYTLPNDAEERLELALARANDAITKKSEFSDKDFHVVFAGVHEQTVHAHFTWRKRRWYWHPETITQEELYELQFGLVSMDLETHTAMVACYTEYERRVLTDAMSEVYGAAFSPMVFTRDVLHYIGEFRTVRKAGYFRAQPPAGESSIISFADQRLDDKSRVVAEEESLRSPRKYSFYRAVFPDGREYGVGATSDKGKLWIPKELPIDKVTEYGLDLLRRIENGVQAEVSEGQIRDALASFNLQDMLVKNGVYPALSSYVATITLEILLLLCSENSEVAYMPPEKLVGAGPEQSIFEYPYLTLSESESELPAISLFRDGFGLPIPVKLGVNKQKQAVIRNARTGKVMDTSELPNPITGELPTLGAAANSNELIAMLHLRPTTDLKLQIGNVIREVAQSPMFADALSEFQYLDFDIWNGVLRLYPPAAAASPEGLPGDVEDDEIGILVESWEHFRYDEKPVTRQRVRRWLNQFASAEERQLMFKCLQHLRVYDRQQAMRQMRLIHESLQADLKSRGLDGVPNENLTLLIGYGTPDKSGQTYVRLYKNANGSRGVKGYEYSNIASLFSSALPQDQQLAGKVRTILLLDDCIVSGGTTKRALKGLDDQAGEELRRRRVKILVAAIVGLESGREAVENYGTSIGLDVRVLFADELTTAYQCFNVDSDVFTQPREREHAKQIAGEYGAKLVSQKYALGYEDGQLLVVLHDNCPNNTLPIIWAKKRLP